MDKRAEVQLFTEELWQNIIAMTANSELTAGDVLQAWETIRGRLQRRQAAERGGDGQGPSGSTTQS